ncbi:MAG: agmatinase [Bacteroidota bacterium]|nr:agmatinase [Bacteroidota bacterium]MDP4232625.1 agmatinase [Bacteroidota bacterium]MDP4243877.1 agmatinase [Bacteroidota bacterium]MDP4289285.1 agmatinase [Bacteroidota bacterium]
MTRALPEAKNFLGLPKRSSTYEASKVVILSAPYEKTTSYGGGTAKGPAAILDASHYVEFLDDELFRELCFEIGIATMPPIAFGKRAGKLMLAHLQQEVAKHLDAGKFVVTLGGEHTISTAPILAHVARYSNMSVLHFDAHSDLRREYSGTPYSHACFMARVADAGFQMSNVVQVGIRAQEKAEYDYAAQIGVQTFYATKIRRGDHGSRWQKAVVSSIPSNEVYVTFDVDYFDPAIMPSTGTPEPDGFLWNETMEIFRELNRAGKRIVGFDVVELAPDSKARHATYLAAKLVYRMLNFAFAG